MLNDKIEEFIICRHKDLYPNEDMQYVENCLNHAEVVYHLFRPWYKRIFDDSFDKIKFVLKHWNDNY